MGSAAAAAGAAKGGVAVGRGLRAKRDAREEQYGTRSRIKAKRDQREAETGHRGRRAGRKAGRKGRLQAQADVTQRMEEAGVAYGKRRGVEKEAIQRQMLAQMEQFAPMQGQMEKMYGGGGYKSPDYKSAIGAGGKAGGGGSRSDPGSSRPLKKKKGDKPGKKKSRPGKKSGLPKRPYESRSGRAGGGGSVGAAIARMA